MKKHNVHKRVNAPTIIVAKLFTFNGKILNTFVNKTLPISTALNVQHKNCVFNKILDVSAISRKFFVILLRGRIFDIFLDFPYQNY